MTRTREVGTLWIGGALSWMEQLCLKSFVDAGQKITLFSYEDIPNVPAGVIRRDGREILGEDTFVKHEEKDSFALFSDLFRLHMILKCPGMIWVDTDVYCHRPMTYDTDYVFGYELPGESRVNGAVLGLPVKSELMAQMMAFTEDRYPIPPFLPKNRQQELREAAARGEPVSVGQMPWGVWGPMLITHYVHKLGLANLVQPLDAFYPITFPERTKFLRPERVAAGMITANTTALHVWASNKRELGKRFDGLPPKGSYFDMLVRRHGINPVMAPIKGRSRAMFEGALLDALDISEISTIADLTGHGRSFVLGAQHKHDCEVHLLNVDRRGRFSEEEQPWIAGYVDFLTENEVDPGRIRVIRSEDQLRQVDVLCNLKGFGDRYKVKHLAPFLDRCLHSETRLFMDVREGSGSFPFLKAWGTNTPLSVSRDGEAKVTRIRLVPNPPAPEPDDGSWDQIAAQLAGQDGWYRPGPAGHSLLFMPRDPGTLVVTFDNLDIAMNKRDQRRPWGYSFIKDQGWSMLGVLAGGWTWYREPWICAQFDELRQSGFFGRFGRVVFYGASMGGYAACAFAPAAPGCDVVAISPQSTLDRETVPWETRYRTAWDRDFSGPYGDAAVASAAARQVSILFDPFEPLDAAHAARFSAPNVRLLRAPFLGHRLGSSLSQMGILTPIILGALSGSLTEAEFRKLLRGRKSFPRYQRELFSRALARGHRDLARSMGRYILTLNPNRAVRQALAEMD